MVGLILLAVYDGKLGELPVEALIYVIIMGLAYAIVEIAWLGVSVESILTLLGSVAILAGTYYLLYFFSKEKLVGGGDWMLCLSIGLILGDWRLALIELFLANFLGALVMLPMRKKRVAFGPFLILAFVIVFVFGDYLINLLNLSI
jgi:prepilin signal peptidase PulO-like enzyme (type II secretory pathway)